MITDKYVLIASGWNNENSLHQQSPSNGQQIPPGSLPQSSNGSRGAFHDSSRFGKGNARAAEESNQMQSQQPGPAGIMQNPPPNLNQPPPKMVNCHFKVLTLLLTALLFQLTGSVGWNQSSWWEGLLLPLNHPRKYLDKTTGRLEHQDHDSDWVRSLQQTANQTNGATCRSNENGVSRRLKIGARASLKLTRTSLKLSSLSEWHLRT